VVEKAGFNGEMVKQNSIKHSIKVRHSEINNALHADLITLLRTIETAPECPNIHSLLDNWNSK